MKKVENAYGNHHNYESVRLKLLEDDKELLTKKDYFLPKDYLEYRCLKCGTVNKIQFQTLTRKDHLHKCKGCKKLEKRKEQWERIIEIAKESNLKVLTTFEEFAKMEKIDNSTPLIFRCSCEDKNVFTVAHGEYIYNNKRQCNKCGIATRSGEFAPRWKGGVTSEYEKIRKSPEYKEWRNAVFERDEYTCMCCGKKTGGDLRAHHIENFSDHEESRLDVSNGITLCDSCHNPN